MPRHLSIAELQSRYGPTDSQASPSVLRQLRRDPRQGARRLYGRLKRRADAQTRETRRIRDLLRIEDGIRRTGVTQIAGVDEVGIGPMAGPVVAAAVVFPPETKIDGVNDSKRLDPSAREALDQAIRAQARGIGIGVVEVAEVDRLNVYHAGLVAMRRAVEALPVTPEFVLVDARTIPGLPVAQQGITRGDSISFSIAAASIVAKVCRDSLMEGMDDRYPGYGFRKHKGYCSPEHQAAVRRLGPSPIHRRSFDFIRELTGEYDPRFYELKEELERLNSLRALELWKTRFERDRQYLSNRGARKLALLAARRHARMLAALQVVDCQ